MKTVKQLEAERASVDAQIELAKARDVFLAKKKAGKLTPEDKREFHALRRGWRENHRKISGPTATPEPIGVKAKGL